MKKLLILLLVFVFIGHAFAQETNESTAGLEDDLFGGDNETLVTPEQANAETKKDPLAVKGDLQKGTLSLENTKFRMGGSLNSELGLKYSWADPYTPKDDHAKAFANPEMALLSPSIGANLFFDARPVQDLKLYGKFVFGFPFEKSLNGAAVAPPPSPPGTAAPVTVNGSPNIKIWELYTDFSAKDIAFFRFGKHTVKWGTGYFYSPADVINISRINPQKPTADREGPVSLRTHIPIPKTQYNIWLYLLPDTDQYKPQHTAAAGKAEFVFGNWELGIGGWYRYEKAPRLITTLSGSIAGQVAVFAEGVFAWGSDHTYHKNDAAFTPYKVINKPFFQATAGCSYSNAKSHTTISAQYYYNGFGYNTDTEALQKIAAMGNRGQHYISLLLAQDKIGSEKVSADLFQQFAITELEGLTTLNFNWRIYKFIQLSTGPSFSYPISPASYSKGSIGYNLSFKLGGGRF